MPPNNPDDLRNIPAMKPARDEVVERRQSPRQAPRPQAAATGFLTYLGLVVAVGAVAAAVFLWQQQTALTQTLQQAEARLVVLESQLASTGDEITQSDAAVRVRLKELDSEVRKLWDNVWKKSKAQLAEHDKNIKNLTQRTGNMQKEGRANTASLTSLSAEVDEIAETLQVLESSSRTNAEQQQQVRDALDKLNSLAIRLESMDQRLKTNEEWVESINAFRQQVNRRLSGSSGLQNETPVLQ